MKKIVIAVVLALITCTAFGQVPAAAKRPSQSPPAPTGADEIAGLKGVVGMDVVMVQNGIHYGDWSMTNKYCQQGKKDLDAQIGDALKAAAGHADLTAAIKAYYIVAQAYFQNAWSDPTTAALIVESNEARLKADMDSKASAMILEAKLAWP